MGVTSLPRNTRPFLRCPGHRVPRLLSFSLSKIQLLGHLYSLPAGHRWVAWAHKGYSENSRHFPGEVKRRGEGEVGQKYGWSQVVPAKKEFWVYNYNYNYNLHCRSRKHKALTHCLCSRGAYSLMIKDSTYNTLVTSSFFCALRVCREVPHSRKISPSRAARLARSISWEDLQWLQRISLLGVQLWHGDSCPVGGCEEPHSLPLERAGHVINLSTSFVKQMRADFCTREVTASEGTILPRDKDDLFCCLFNRGYRKETPPLQAILSTDGYCYFVIYFFPFSSTHLFCMAEVLL